MSKRTYSSSSCSNPRPIYFVLSFIFSFLTSLSSASSASFTFRFSFSCLASDAEPRLELQYLRPQPPQSFYFKYTPIPRF
ncbi:uncharacterized protein K444DRAFT_367269 [Hyaloscypha bicolor E]|uniref:Uncharacterized protein n=1 Tax=Hyaloscypha bicolor E TaxID=1095630 RepID=A0A2J6TE56_9HELO|nr:uncharacterized protein K444DRAFT_367269 [Hyaloscypha bicolor E]PMD61307.1 hypothetical protein K444DRAFT_367269 [Hyaloscypha bicolor E]